VTTPAQDDIYAPVRIHLASVEPGVSLGGHVPAAQPRRRLIVRAKTFVLTAAEPSRLIAPTDKERVQLWLIGDGATGAIVGHSRGDVAQYADTTFAAPPEDTLYIPPVSQAASQAVVQGAQPAPGAQFVYTNTTGTAQSLISVQGLLTASSAVLNRFISATIKDSNGNILYKEINGSATVASTNISWNGFVGASHGNSATGTFTFPLPIPPNSFIPPGGTLTLGSGALDAADQISAVVLVFQAGTPGLAMLPCVPVPFHTTEALYAASPGAAGATTVKIRVIMISESVIG
jgi:hypothetical protein